MIFDVLILLIFLFISNIFKINAIIKMYMNDQFAETDILIYQNREIFKDF